MKKLILLLCCITLLSCSNNEEEKVILSESERLKIEEVNYQKELLEFEASLKDIEDNNERQRLQDEVDFKKQELVEQKRYDIDFIEQEEKLRIELEKKIEEEANEEYDAVHKNLNPEQQEMLELYNSRLKK
jgi:very-short-patch-repair endonuclease